MRVHHLNCGTMNPPTAPRQVCHVLLVESDNGLVLVDSGYGLGDIADPARRLGPTRRFFRPVYDPDETALRQIERLGLRAEDVRHIVTTHFDFDHIGGISDFPHARIHVTAAEVRGARNASTFDERLRFRPAQWEHGPHIVEHDPDGESWRGFAVAKELTEVAPGIVLVSLPGHTRGHACVAVDAGHRWVLHAGDAFFHRGSVDGQSPVPRIVRFMEPKLAHDRTRLPDNHARLAELYQRRDPDLFVVCSHDAVLYERAKETA
ncbi:MBL fold metallo-hydrolase [Mycobacterium deserti]|uniref:MBL fold metallo-hydrolase n=1 Tax=Mycobacterium deserti TaxID=2978347 RepID=A0ABT2M5T3_9MYCO|nr:MBL fold metallo-hydrolase [Mycobacterium deserti]MCT7657622.1 MBL fold metallo-hydrolase [Mycobacterium deserti]